MAQATQEQLNHPLRPSFGWCSDVGCWGGNPPDHFKFQVVDIATGEQVFDSGEIKGGTSNIGEFLGIVTALALSKKQGLQTEIYTDSVTAMTWVRNKRVKTTYDLSSNPKLENMVNRALKWLKAKENRKERNMVKKWLTDMWGEIPADYGRK